MHLIFGSTSSLCAAAKPLRPRLRENRGHVVKIKKGPADQPAEFDKCIAAIESTPSRLRW